MADPENELLLMVHRHRFRILGCACTDWNLEQLLSNLRNTAASFGADSPRYKEAYETVHEHLASMRAAGLKTDLTQAKGTQSQNAAADGDLSAALAKMQLELDSSKH